ncbi:MAG: ATP-binding cassette domain-containing protein, partial [Acidimicrobiales bacterium]
GLRRNVIRTTATSQGPLPDQLSHGIVIEDLTFSYPGSDRPALAGISVEIPRGSVVAVVGENGAGKTTLAKVLTGLATPSAGRVLVDGRDLAQLDLVAWRTRIGAAFQDFARFELTLAETVGVGHLESIGDEAAIRLALERAAGPGLEESMPAGLSTRLGASWDGRRLSGGQWQGLALARGSMRPTPLLLMLDEPTASLDPRAEHRVFESYAALARETAETWGTISIFVTHRFAAAPTANLVLVLREGRLIEAGGHRELLLRDGHYAHLYRLQAGAYR